MAVDGVDIELERVLVAAPRAGAMGMDRGSLSDECRLRTAGGLD